MNKLLLPFACNIQDKLVHINNASKGEEYRCPNCGVELLLRISKIPEGQKYHRRNHFAHKGNAENHCSESFLHKLFKEKCAELIRARIFNKQDLIYTWQCEICGEEHKGALVSNAVGIETEYNLGVCHPDIALLDKNGKVLLVIEVVVTHKPESFVLQYYKDNHIVCMQIKVSDFSDCDCIEDKLSRPDKVNICPNPICDKCGEVMHNAKIITVVGDCWQCKHQMTIAMMAVDANIVGPKDFNNEEIAIARTLGANIQQCYSKTREENYYANVCQCCNAFIGDFYLHDYIYMPHEHEIDLEYKCLNCLEYDTSNNDT